MFKKGFIGFGSDLDKKIQRPEYARRDRHCGCIGSANLPFPGLAALDKVVAGPHELVRGQDAFLRKGPRQTKTTKTAATTTVEIIGRSR